MQKNVKIFANINYFYYLAAENVIFNRFYISKNVIYYIPHKTLYFFVHDADSLIPVEVKAKDGATASLNNLIKWESYPDVHYGIKLGYKNIGWNGAFYTFPYFLTFLLKRFLAERKP